MSDFTATHNTLVNFASYQERRPALFPLDACTRGQSFVPFTMPLFPCYLEHRPALFPLDARARGQPFLYYFKSRYLPASAYVECRRGLLQVPPTYTVNTVAMPFSVLSYSFAFRHMIRRKFWASFMSSTSSPSMMLSLYG
jgi:hypothetical protein